MEKTSQIESKQSNNKRIAKNTILLYFRMLLTMVVSLYTSRVVLGALGVEDYGIYNVACYAVVMFLMLLGLLLQLYSAQIREQNIHPLYYIQFFFLRYFKEQKMAYSIKVQDIVSYSNPVSSYKVREDFTAPQI